MTVLINQPDLVYNGREYWWLGNARDGQGAFVDKDNYILTDDEYKAHLAELKRIRESGWSGDTTGSLDSTNTSTQFRGTDVIINGRVYDSVEIIDMGCNNVIPQHTLDEQYQISDHIIEQAPKFILTINASLENGEYEALRLLEKRKTFFEVTLPFGHYKNMVVESIKFQSGKSINRVQTTLTIKEIRIGHIRVMTSPDLIIQHKAESAMQEKAYTSLGISIEGEEEDPYKVDGDIEYNWLTDTIVTIPIPLGHPLLTYDWTTPLWIDPRDNVVSANDNLQKERYYETKYSLTGYDVVDPWEKIQDDITPDILKNDPEMITIEAYPWTFTVAPAMQIAEDERLVPKEEREADEE